MPTEWWQYLVIVVGCVHIVAVGYGIRLLAMELREMKEKK